MADNIVKSLNSALAAPSSLDQQRAGRGFYLDEHTTPIPSEGNMLTLLTMKDLVASENDKKALMGIAQEESKYLVHAAKILQAVPSGDKKEQIARIQDKFGKNFAGATELATLLKNESLRREWEDEIGTFLNPAKFTRKQAGALAAADIV